MQTGSSKCAPRWVQRLCCFLTIRRTSPIKPLTIITHGSFDIISHGGFQPPGVPPDWTATMQQALRARGVVDAAIMNWSAVSGHELCARILWQAQQRNITRRSTSTSSAIAGAQ